ncbi:MAG: hypothetical protein HQM00_10515 [Magnetococcales bacterium]|nr:hypothetical protein [Magnetococcales bacterium]
MIDKGFMKNLRLLPAAAILGAAGIVVVAIGCGGGKTNSSESTSVTETVTLEGIVQGTIVMALDETDEVISTASANQVVDGGKKFSLKIPVSQKVKLFLMPGSGTGAQQFIPFLFEDESGNTKQEFKIAPGEANLTKQLGSINVSAVGDSFKAERAATNKKISSVLNVDTTQLSQSPAVTSVANITIPPKLNDPSQWRIVSPGTNVDELIRDGLHAWRQQWMAGAFASFKRAHDLSGTSTDANLKAQTAFYYGMSVIANLMTRTGPDGTPGDFNTVGDLLAQLGCNSTKDNITGNNLAALQASYRSGREIGLMRGGMGGWDMVACPASDHMPANAPNLNQFKTFLASQVAPNLQVAEQMFTIAEGVATISVPGYSIGGRMNEAELAQDSNPQQPNPPFLYDLKDIQFMHAWSLYLRGQIRVLEAYQTDLPLADLRNVTTTDQQFWDAHGTLGSKATDAISKLSATTDAGGAGDLIRKASVMMQAALTNVTRTDTKKHINDDLTQSESANVLAKIDAALTSMNGASEMGRHNVEINLSAFFNGGLDLHALPGFSTAGELDRFTDYTVGGIFVDQKFTGGIPLADDAHYGIPGNQVPYVLDKFFGEENSTGGMAQD